MWHIEIDIYPTKPMINLFINVSVLSDLSSTVDYPKKPVLGSILKPPVSNEIGPRFVKRGPNGLRVLSGRLAAGAI